MPNRSHDKTQRSKRIAPSLSLKLEATGGDNPNVDAEDFFSTAKKWLEALKAFAKDQGQAVKWEIVDLRKSSALIEVQPVKVKTGKSVPILAKKWDAGFKKIAKQGRSPKTFTPESLAALQEFVSSIPRDTIVSLGNGTDASRLPVTAFTIRHVQEAIEHLPQQPRAEYESYGNIRGRLAVLNSWNQEDRSFRLQLPLDPSKPVKCTYKDASLVSELGEGFEGMVEIAGKLRYKPNQAWPFSASVDHIRVLPKKTTLGLKDLVGLIHLPEGQDSVSYVRRLRDAE